MEYIALAVGVLCLAAAWFARARAQALETRLDAANDRIFALMNRVREMDEQVQEQIANLRLDARRQAGLLKFEPQMTIEEVAEMHPRAADVLADFHLGGCSSCAVRPDQTLADAARQRNVGLDRLLDALRELADGAPAAGAVATDTGSARFQPAPGLSKGRTPDPDLRIVG